MDTSLYVLRNEATTTAFRHDTLDEALAALNDEVGERDLWVLFELDRDRVAARRVAEGRGRINRSQGSTMRDPEDVAMDDAALCDEIAYEWRRLHAIARLADAPHGTPWRLAAEVSTLER
jgi:hypothetical protein